MIENTSTASFKSVLIAYLTNEDLKENESIDEQTLALIPIDPFRQKKDSRPNRVGRPTRAIKKARSVHLKPCQAIIITPAIWESKEDIPLFHGCQI